MQDYIIEQLIYLICKLVMKFCSNVYGGFGVLRVSVLIVNDRSVFDQFTRIVVKTNQHMFKSLIPVLKFFTKIFLRIYPYFCFLVYF